MAQIRESQFAVMRIQDNDLDLLDLAGEGGVTVEVEHENYNQELEQEISELNEGDIVTGKIQGEDILQPNAIWRFLEFEVIGNNPRWIRE